ncbi:MAG: hypothetical protein J6J12_00210 [Oscillospiraceae bacterium]|nr:hypothetical protein [Oscillospiraceae bacterium]
MTTPAQGTGTLFVNCTITGEKTGVMDVPFPDVVSAINTSTNVVMRMSHQINGQPAVYFLNLFGYSPGERGLIFTNSMVMSGLLSVTTIVQVKPDNSCLVEVNEET